MFDAEPRRPYCLLVTTKTTKTTVTLPDGTTRVARFFELVYIGECLASIQSARSMADLQVLASTYRATGSAFSALAPVEQMTVRTAWAARRDAIRTLVSVVL